MRLHLPAVRHESSNPDLHSKAYERVRPIVLIRAAGIRQELDRSEFLANASLLLPKDYRARRGPALEADDGARLELDFRPALPSVGHVYQSRLHYLRCARADTYLQYGLYLPGASHPLTYVAMSACDRRYRAASVLASGLYCNHDEYLVVTRMYGLPGIPANMMSLTLKHVIRAVRQTGRFKLLLTAYNPMLAFTGAALHASGFRPFALAPVSYRYSARGEFSTRRRSADPCDGSRDVGQNVLTARGVDRSSQRDITTKLRMSEVPTEAYLEAAPRERRLPEIRSEQWRDRLRLYRKLLEEAWSTRTIHPSYLTDHASPQPRSRGQCGVSSVWLTKELRRSYSTEATYCFGDLIFTNGEAEPVQHHCWVEIGADDDPQRVVIDLTFDQSDLPEEPVLCDNYAELRGRGLDYRAFNRLSLEKLPDDRVWQRFLALCDVIADPPYGTE